MIDAILNTIRAQTFEVGDLAIVALLVLLEGVLSIDNALVLGLLARRLPEDQRKKALTYGLVGALVFRIIAIFLAAWLLKTRFVKLLGGAYLVYLAIKHVVFPQKQHTKHQTGQLDTKSTTQYAKFWPTVAAIEFTDIAFAVDSILAAIALVSEYGAGASASTHPKLWVVVTGGMLGVILIRVAAVIFIRLIERFPRFEVAAYLLVFVIGCKLMVEWKFNIPGKPAVVDFQSPHHPGFWIFWSLMVASFAVGFIPKKTPPKQSLAA